MSLTHKWNKLVLWTITSPPSEMMRSSKCFLHVSKIPTLTYNRENNVHKARYYIVMHKNDIRMYFFFFFYLYDNLRNIEISSIKLELNAREGAHFVPIRRQNMLCCFSDLL